MSYIRAGWPMLFVEADSPDYVYLTGKDGEEYIEDGGLISNEGLIEIIARNLPNKDGVLFKYILKKLSEKLKVKLREKPLTDEEQIKIMEKYIERDVKLFEK